MRYVKTAGVLCVGGGILRSLSGNWSATFLSLGILLIVGGGIAMVCTLLSRPIIEKELAKIKTMVDGAVLPFCVLLNRNPTIHDLEADLHGNRKGLKIFCSLFSVGLLFLLGGFSIS